MKLLQDLIGIQGPSGHEAAVRDYLVKYVKKASAAWRTKPEIIMGEEFQDCLMLRFGKPRTAIYAHMDTVGFTVRYYNQLVSIGSPDAEMGTRLVGRDSRGAIDCTLE
ncbi:MAG: aminopeptidase, partial [Cyclobacteriaceae bacterium]|nr:aminopeptidase [Cyclobacteriaceae bacterium]